MRFRYALLALEAVVAAGCLYSGWRFLSTRTTGPDLVVHRAQAPAPPGPIEAAIQGLLPTVQPTSAPPRPGAPVLGPDLVNQINRDDLELYRREWQVIQMVVEGVRRYVEVRVVPGL